MARDDWRLNLTPDEIQQERQQLAYNGFHYNPLAWVGDPNSFSVNDPNLIKAFEAKKYNPNFQFQDFKDNVFQKGFTTAAAGKSAGIPIPAQALAILSLGAAGERFLNKRDNQYWNAFTNLRENLGRYPTQEEYNSYFKKQPSTFTSDDAFTALLAFNGTAPALKKIIPNLYSKYIQYKWRDTDKFFQNQDKAMKDYQKMFKIQNTAPKVIDGVNDVGFFGTAAAKYLGW